MPQDPVLPPKPRRRRPSSTRMMRSAIAAGLNVRGIRVDPISGAYTVLIGEPTPADKGEPGDNSEWDGVLK